MSTPNVAVIDIGSNSIKVLVATRGANGAVVPLFTKSLDARISAGISAAAPRLGEEGMRRGVEAVEQLLQAAAQFAPQRVCLVATSAVRDAQNGAEFRAQIKARTGHEVRLLSGTEEANGIGRGLAADPALSGLQNFYDFDLGGGSLECLAFQQRRIEQAISLQLGCVRLMERFVVDSKAHFSDESRERTQQHVRDEFSRSGFRFNIAGATAIATGGTVATVRAVLGAKRGVKAEDTPSRVTKTELAELLAELAALPLEARRAVNGMPPGRADVFPTALATVLTVAEIGGFAEFHHSFYNLRYGIAAELLETV